MAPVPRQEFTFKFVLNGETQGIFSSKGAVDPQHLTLGEETIPLDRIVETTRRESRLILALADGTPLGKNGTAHLVEGWLLILEITTKNINDIQRFINKVSSHLRIEAVKADLLKRGKSDTFRVAHCPLCKAEIDLSGIEPGTYVYCRYCETLFAEPGRILSNGDEYRICGECGMFGRVGYYTEFYFYFLLVIYGWRYQRHALCDGCAGSKFWKQLLYNLLFVIGIIPALILKFRSMTGRNPDYGNLVEANALAGEGLFHQADPLYAVALQKFPDHPGILYNKGLGHTIGQDADGGWDFLKASMKACPNFLPVISFLEKASRNADGK